MVVTALGIKRQEKALSYNVQQVSSELLTQVKDPNFINSLNGKVAGVNINASSVGVGGATRVVMRGPKSISGSNQALYVIDGVPVFNTNNGIVTGGRYGMAAGGEGISDINPDDIESLSVLSGPAAAALYGSSAAQGVIMITTKRGKQGILKVSLSNSTQYMTPFVSPRFQTRYINLPGETSTWSMTPGESPFGTYNPLDFFNTGTNISTTVSLTTGTEKNQTYFSAGATNSGGIVPHSRYDRYNFTFRNTTSFLQDKAKLDFSLNYIQQSSNNISGGQGEYMNPILPVYLWPRGENFETVRAYRIWSPARNIYEQNWSDNSMNMQNPYWIAYEMNRESLRKRFMINAQFSYDFTDWLKGSIRVREDQVNVLNEDKRAATTLDLFTKSPYGYYAYDKALEAARYLEGMLTANKVWEDWSINGILGTSSSRESFDDRGFGGGLKAPSNIFTPNAIDYTKGIEQNRPIYGGWKHVTNSLFGSAEVGYKSAYYLTLTGRNDWDSSLAGTRHESFFYPSVGGSVLLSEVLPLPSAFSFLKLRGSWASVGSPIPRNLSTPAQYSYNPKTGGYTTQGYLLPEEFFPERTNSIEGGLTVKLFKGLIDLDMSVYKSNTTNQTFKRNISGSGGFNTKYIQMGDVQNIGVELSLGVDKSWKDFSLSSIFTYSANRNKIVELLEDPKEEIYADGLDGLSLIMRKGGTMGDMYVRQDLARDHEGFIVINEKNNVVKKELAEPRYVGSVLPKANLGWRNDLAWKGVSLGFMLSARLGGIVASQTQALLDQYGVSETSAQARDNGGIQINDIKVDPRSYYSVVGGTSPIWSEYIYDGTNVRLQEAYVGYHHKINLLGKEMRMGLRLVGRNLLMIYNKAPFDPELTASTGTFYQGIDYFMQPSMSSYGFNINLEF